MINTIGPVWDGNEVWLLTAGGATFAAFPEWYATLFSGFYLPLLLILLRSSCAGSPSSTAARSTTRAGGRWRPSRWSGPGCPPCSGASRSPTSSRRPARRGPPVRRCFWALLNPFALLGGVTTVLFLLHGAVFLALKTDGDIRARAAALAARSSVVTPVVAGGWAVWTQLAYSCRGPGWPSRRGRGDRRARRPAQRRTEGLAFTRPRS